MAGVERKNLYDFEVHLDEADFEIVKAIADRDNIEIEFALKLIITDGLAEYYDTLL